MKKNIKLGLIMILLIVLTSCTETPKESTAYRQLFDNLYDRNFEEAERHSNYGLSIDDICNYNIYDYAEGGEKEIQNCVLDSKIMNSEEISRVILAEKTDEDSTYYWRIEIIEFKNMEAAKKVMVQESMQNIYYARYQNIVYFLDVFSSVFVNGRFYLEDGYCCDKDFEILYYVEENILMQEEFKIPDSFKYVLYNGFNSYGTINISKITCGENLRRIGDFAFYFGKELEYFESNKNLISIGKQAFFDSPKLKTVILNEGLEYIDDMAFAECPSLEYVVIPESVKDIGYEAFTSGILYIEEKFKPVEWDVNFAGKDVIVYWSNEWEYNEEGIPVPIE